jgi:hypothetical protein
MSLIENNNFPLQGQLPRTESSFDNSIAQNMPVAGAKSFIPAGTRVEHFDNPPMDGAPESVKSAVNGLLTTYNNAADQHNALLERTYKTADHFSKGEDHMGRNAFYLGEHYPDPETGIITPDPLPGYKEKGSHVSQLIADANTVRGQWSEVVNEAGIAETKVYQNEEDLKTVVHYTAIIDSIKQGVQINASSVKTAINVLKTNLDELFSAVKNHEATTKERG